MEFFPISLRTPPLPVVAIVGGYNPVQHLLIESLHACSVSKHHTRRCHYVWTDFGFQLPVKLDLGKKEAPNTEGIIKEDWFAKVRSLQQPAAVIFFLDWTAYPKTAPVLTSNSQSALAALPPEAQAQVAQVRELESHAVAQVEGFRESVKARYHKGRQVPRLIVFLVLPEGLPKPEERVRFLQTALPTGALQAVVVTVGLPADQRGLMTKVERVESLAYDLSCEYYKEREEDCLRTAQRHRHSGSHGSGPSQAQVQIMKVRAYIKNGFFAEFRNDARASLGGYIRAWEACASDTRVGDAEERMTVCNYLSLRMFDIYLDKRDVSKAAFHFKAHAACLRESGNVPTEAIKEYLPELWNVQMHLLFAAMLQKHYADFPREHEPRDLFHVPAFHQKRAALQLRALRMVSRSILMAVTQGATAGGGLSRVLSSERQAKAQGTELVRPLWVGKPPVLRHPDGAVADEDTAALRRLLWAAGLATAGEGGEELLLSNVVEEFSRGSGGGERGEGAMRVSADGFVEKTESCSRLLVRALGHFCEMRGRRREGCVLLELIGDELLEGGKTREAFEIFAVLGPLASAHGWWSMATLAVARLSVLLLWSGGLAASSVLCRLASLDPSIMKEWGGASKTGGGGGILGGLSGTEAGAVERLILCVTSSKTGSGGVVVPSSPLRTQRDQAVTGGLAGGLLMQCLLDLNGLLLLNSKALGDAVGEKRREIAGALRSASAICGSSGTVPLLGVPALSASLSVSLQGGGPGKGGDSCGLIVSVWVHGDLGDSVAVQKVEIFGTVVGEGGEGVVSQTGQEGVLGVWSAGAPGGEVVWQCMPDGSAPCLRVDVGISPESLKSARGESGSVNVRGKKESLAVASVRLSCSAPFQGTVQITQLREAGGEKGTGGKERLSGQWPGSVSELSVILEDCSLGGRATTDAVGKGRRMGRENVWTGWLRGRTSSSPISFSPQTTGMGGGALRLPLLLSLPEGKGHTGGDAQAFDFLDLSLEVPPLLRGGAEGDLLSLSADSGRAETGGRNVRPRASLHPPPPSCGAVGSGDESGTSSGRLSRKGKMQGGVVACSTAVTALLGERVPVVLTVSQKNGLREALSGHHQYFLRITGSESDGMRGMKASAAGSGGGVGGRDKDKSEGERDSVALSRPSVCVVMRGDSDSTSTPLPSGRPCPLSLFPISSSSTQTAPGSSTPNTDMPLPLDACAFPSSSSGTFPPSHSDSGILQTPQAGAPVEFSFLSRTEGEGRPSSSSSVPLLFAQRCNSTEMLSSVGVPLVLSSHSAGQFLFTLELAVMKKDGNEEVVVAKKSVLVSASFFNPFVVSSKASLMRSPLREGDKREENSGDCPTAQGGQCRRRSFVSRLVEISVNSSGVPRPSSSNHPHMQRGSGGGGGGGGTRGGVGEGSLASQPLMSVRECNLILRSSDGDRREPRVRPSAPKWLALSESPPGGRTGRPGNESGKGVLSLKGRLSVLFVAPVGGSRGETGGEGRGGAGTSMGIVSAEAQIPTHSAQVDAFASAQVEIVWRRLPQSLPFPFSSFPYNMLASSFSVPLPPLPPAASTWLKKPVRIVTDHPERVLYGVPFTLSATITNSGPRHANLRVVLRAPAGSSMAAGGPVSPTFTRQGTGGGRRSSSASAAGDGGKGQGPFEELPPDFPFLLSGPQSSEVFLLPNLNLPLLGEGPGEGERGTDADSECCSSVTLRFSLVPVRPGPAFLPVVCAFEQEKAAGGSSPGESDRPGVVSGSPKGAPAQQFASSSPTKMMSSSGLDLEAPGFFAGPLSTVVVDGGS
uniref:Trafficking protein particle complex subunit 11 domain-containing protein n=1 Tax=Chromera velia CCMP2878 TaxID=1169474 RepID=A0A0G4I3E8_9ALVE|eukprot:Cvel_10661.t1-p1 / transcript=Cvel_10661.t1 / gene=Cvel_10661 / organism=Chromera_velia_CCMP2878 / gene_product=hypothetical protein / transcript_product=hypothetical protein / location=Cvel_scaffold648:3720-14948(-) / protein_length=1783 / sequence_SO=supercontig / SO=protein_coding / is_pseudo=false